MYKRKIVHIILPFFLLIVFQSAGQTGKIPVHQSEPQNEDFVASQKGDLLKLPNKLVPVTNSVYKLLDYYESAGMLGFLPQAKPYTKSEVAKYLHQLLDNNDLTEREQKNIQNYLSDFYRPVNGLIFKAHEGNQTYTVVGSGAKIDTRIGAGNNATWSTSNIVEPFIAGDLGRHITYFGGMGAAVDRLAPDIFFQGYVKDGSVHFPYESVGYAFHPYQFQYETMYSHVNSSGEQGEGPPIQDNLTAGMIYHSELSGTWFNNALRVSFHNQQRSWGVASDNLVLSGHARRFPGIDLFIQPAPWIRYSFVTGSLFSYLQKYDDDKSAIYGYDTGNVYKMLTLHMLEVTPGNHFQVSVSGGNIWSKRLELAYLMPFVIPHLTQLDVGNYDNLSLDFNFAFLFPEFGKAWFNFFVDEFSFTKKGNYLKMPRNRYAWQVGWNTSLLNKLIPGTQTQISYSRLTPFVYTHYPETRFNTVINNRPLDMTYTHDEANLGFYLPPNSGEFRMSFVNMAVPDLTVKLDNRFIIHGTNDLAGDTYQIFGDIYRHQIGEVYDYPSLDFTRDGIYDYTWFSEFRVDYRARWVSYLNYFRIFGAVGVSTTWWESNQSQVAAPGNQSLFTFNFGVAVDI